MLRAGELGALISMHAEIGLPIDVLVQRALAEGHTAPIYHALTRPEVAEATGTERAIALAEMAKVPVYIVHLSAQRALERVMEARDRGLPAYAETCPQYLFLAEDDLRGEPGNEFEGRELRVHAAAAPEAPPRAPVARPAQLRPPGRLDRSLPVLHEGSEGARQRTTSRRSRTACRASRRACTCCGKACAQGKISMNRFVEITSTAPAKIFGMYPQEGHDRGRRRRRRRRVGSEKRDEAARQEHAAHARRLLAVRGPRGRRRAVARALARRADRRERRVGRQDQARAAASSCAAERSIYEQNR